MTKARERAIKMYWEMAKEKCPFQTEEIVNGYLEGFIDCAELFEEEDKFTLTKYARIIIDKKDECIEGLEQKLEQTEKDLADYQFNYPKIKELEEENGKLLQRITQLEKNVTENESDCSMCDFPKLKQDLEKENAELKKQLDKARDIINCLVHLGEFNENTVEEYLNYQVHDALKQAEQFIKEYEIREDRLCEYCEQYKSCPDGKHCRTCDNGSKWKRSKEND